MDNNKDVCFRRNGSFTRSRDCHDDLYFFSAESGSPGELDLMVFDGIINQVSRRFRLIPFSEEGFSQFTESLEDFPGVKYNNGPAGIFCGRLLHLTPRKSSSD